MENSTLLPFIRNQYFFGKLLTQRDMEAEQVYLNNKRRLINFLMYGSGVVCGMSVLKVDGQTIAVESGMALDGLGRELVLDKPVITRLSEVCGFEQDRGTALYAYLCAEYAEIPREPMHAMTDTALAENRYGRTEESVLLYLRYGEPEPGEIMTARPEAVSPEEWHIEALEKKLERGGVFCLVLAKIHLVRWEDVYEIDRIDPLPYRQRATVPLMAETSVVPSPSEPAVTEPVSQNEGEKPIPSSVFGTATLHIPAGARFGSLHYSEEIPHSLGLTSVSMAVGLHTDGGVVFGDGSIFGAGEYEWAVRANDASGTFQIGVRVKADMPERVLRFTWMAAAHPQGTSEHPPEPLILVSPGYRRVTFLQTVQFSATVYGLPQNDVIWSVREQDGGSITRDGYYIAPNTEGVFTIRATSATHPLVTGSAFLIVAAPI